MDRQLPPIIAGMAQAEREDFVWWLQECLSMDFDKSSNAQLERAAHAWYDYNYSLSQEPSL